MSCKIHVTAWSEAVRSFSWSLNIFASLLLRSHLGIVMLPILLLELLNGGLVINDLIFTTQQTNQWFFGYTVQLLTSFFISLCIQNQYLVIWWSVSARHPRRLNFTFHHFLYYSYKHTSNQWGHNKAYLKKKKDNFIFSSQDWIFLVLCAKMIKMKEIVSLNATSQEREKDVGGKKCGGVERRSWGESPDTDEAVWNL